MLDAILSDHSSHSATYGRGLAAKLGFNPGYVQLVLDKFLKEHLIYPYYSPAIRRTKPIGRKLPYAPEHLALVRAISEIQDATVSQVETWLSCLGFQSQDLFTAFLPRDLRHLRQVCSIAMSIVNQTRGVMHKVNPSAYTLKAVYMAIVAYFVQNPALQTVKDRVVSRIQALQQLFETPQMKQLLIMDDTQLTRFLQA